MVLVAHIRSLCMQCCRVQNLPLQVEFDNTIDEWMGTRLERVSERSSLLDYKLREREGVWG